MNSVRSNIISLKYQRFTPKGCNDIEIKMLNLWQRLNSFYINKLFIQIKNSKAHDELKYFNPYIFAT